MIIIKMFKLFLNSIFLFFLTLNCVLGAEDFNEWKLKFKSRAIKTGISEKVVDEIRNIHPEGFLNASEIYSLRYLRNCILEMLRLNNPVVTTFRTALKDLKLGNHKFKKGDQLLILNNPVLRTPEVFKNPDKYIPERWVDNLEDSYHAISFNQGPQQCPAKELAIFLVQCFIVNFVKTTGIIKNIKKLQTAKINTDKIGQVINTCNLEFNII